MANILLKAILDTSDVTKQISTLHKDLTKGSNLKEGLNLFSKGSIEKSTNDLKLMRHHLRAFENETGVLKRDGLFGNVTGIKKLNREFQTMFSNSTSSNISKVKFQINETKSALESLEQLALKGRSKSFQDVWSTEGSAGLLARSTAGSGMQNTFKTIGAQESIRKLVDLEPQLNTLRNMGQELVHIDAKAVKLSKSLKDSFNPLINFFNNLGVAGNSLFNIFGTLVAKVGTWLVATTMLYGTMKVVTSVMSEMKALQDAEYNLRRVIGGTNEEIEDRIKLSFSFAKSMNILAGSSYKDTITALENVTKAGFKFAESLYITRAALLGVNVAELTADESSKYLIATIRQFNLDASDSLWIMNQWNELGQTTGATTREIAEAVIRSGKAFQAVGGSLNQLNAIAAATIEATGESGEKIGTMLKTVSARYADLSTKKSLEKMLAVPNLEIDIYDENKDEFNNIFEVLQKLSMKWNTLGEAQQAEIGKVAAGVRQWSRFLGIVENFDGVMNGLISSFESNNSLLTENAKRVNSLDFAIRRLQGAMSGLAKSKGSAVLLKLTTNLMYGLTGAINTIFSPIGLFTVALYGTYRAIKFLNTELKITRALTLANALNFNILQKSALSFRLITKIINPYIAGIVMATGVIAAMAGAAEKAKQKNEELRSTLYETTKALYNTNTEFQKNIGTLVNYYKTLGNTDSDNAIKDRLDDLFSDKIGKTLTQAFKDGAKAGKEFEDVLNDIKNKASELTKIKRIIKDITDIILEANKQTWVDKLLPWESYTSKLRTSLVKVSKMITDAVGEDDIAEVSAKFARIDSIVLKNFGKHALDNIVDLNKGILLYKNTLKNIVIPSNKSGKKFGNVDQIAVLEQAQQLIKDAGVKLDLGLDTEGNWKKDVAAKANALNKLIKYNEDFHSSLKAEGIDLDFSMVDVDAFLKAWSTLSTESKEVFQKKLKELADGESDTETEKRNRLLKIVESYYDSEYEKAKATYDKIKALNDSMVSSFNEGLLDLSEGVTFGQRMENAFSGVGDTLFSTLVGDINKQISDVLTGEAPKSMAEMLKEAMEIGGTEAEKSILDGFIASVGTLDDAMKVWQDRLAYAVQGKTSEDLTKAGINLALPGKSIATTRRDQLIAEYEARLKGLSGNGGNRVLQGSEDISKWLKETLFGKGDTKGLFSGFEGLETIGKDAFSGMGLGAYAAGMAGKDATAGGGLGGIFSAIGGTFGGPAGALIGGILGGILAPDKKKDEDKAEEQINYAKQSNKELQYINRNTTAMVEELKNFSIMQDSYYFSFSNSANRGLIG